MKKTQDKMHYLKSNSENSSIVSNNRENIKSITEKIIFSDEDFKLIKEDVVKFASRQLKSNDNAIIEGTWNGIKQIWPSFNLVEELYNTVIRNSDKNLTEEALKKYNLYKTIDILFLLKANENNLAIIQDNINKNQDILIELKQKMSSKNKEIYNAFVTEIKKNHYEMAQFYSTIDNYTIISDTPPFIDSNSYEILGYGFNNIPKAHSHYIVKRDSILKEIINSIDNNRVTLIYADGGYGKSVLLAQYIENIDLEKLYNGGFAYSFYGQGDPEKNNFVDSIEFFKKCFRAFKINESEYFTKERHKRLYVDKLVDFLKDKKVLLVIDGLEVIQDNKGAIKDNDFSDFLNKIYATNFRSKILISSRKRLNFRSVENISINYFSKKDAKKYLFEETGIKINFKYPDNVLLRIPIVLTLISIIISKDNSSDKDSINNLIKKYMNFKKQDELINTLISKIFETEDEKVGYFFKLASIFDQPMDDMVYDNLQSKLDKYLPAFHIIKKELHNLRLAIFDDEDADIKRGIEGTFDIHPKVKRFFFNKFKEEETSLFKIFCNKIAEYYEDKYDINNNFFRIFIFTSMKYYALSKEYKKIEKTFLEEINGSELIRIYAMHKEALDVLKYFQNSSGEFLSSYLSPQNQYYIYKSYKYLLMSLGQSIELGIFLNSINKDKLKRLIKQANNIDNMEIEEIDWKISVLDDCRAIGNLKDLKLDKKDLSNPPSEDIKSIDFWKFLYNCRVDECLYILGKDINFDIDSKIKLKNKYLRGNEEKYYKHPHIIWDERLISFELNKHLYDYICSGFSKIDDETYKQLSVYEKILKKNQQNYIKWERNIYKPLASENLMKISIMRLLKNPNNSMYNDNYKKYRQQALNDIKELSGKPGFQIQVLASCLLCDYINKKELDNEIYKKYEELLKNSNDRFLLLGSYMLRLLITKNLDFQQQAESLLVNTEYKLFASRLEYIKARININHS